MTADGKAIPYKHSKSGKYLHSDLSFTIKEDLSNIKLLEVDGDNVKSIDFVKPQEQKQKENSEVSDNEKSEHTENNDENPLATINSLSDFIFSAIKAIGVILLGFGVGQIGLSLRSHDASQRANGFLTFFGGVIIAFAKDILDMIM